MWALRGAQGTVASSWLGPLTWCNSLPPPGATRCDVRPTITPSRHLPVQRTPCLPRAAAASALSAVPLHTARRSQAAWPGVDAASSCLATPPGGHSCGDGGAWPAHGPGLQATAEGSPGDSARCRLQAARPGTLRAPGSRNQRRRNWIREGPAAAEGAGCDRVATALRAAPTWGRAGGTSGSLQWGWGPRGGAREAGKPRGEGAARQGAGSAQAAPSRRWRGPGGGQAGGRGGVLSRPKPAPAPCSPGVAEIQAGVRQAATVPKPAQL